MRTIHTLSKRKQTLPQPEIKNHGFFGIALGILLLLVATAAPALAVDSVWNMNPGSGEWNMGNNWVGGVAPVNAGDTATFNNSTIRSLSLSNDVTIDSMTFTSLAVNSYTIATNGNSFSLIGDGIVNQSGVTQTINNNGGVIIFDNNASAGDATIQNNGTIVFKGDSTGGTARVEVFGNGSLDITLHVTPSVTVGSIEGDGNVFLGAKNLTVGSNNMSTVFSGVIQDGLGFTGGSLTKIGTGTLTLTGANTYTGITTINAGVLSISSDANLGAAPGAGVPNQLTFNGGTLQATARFITLNPFRGITLEDGGGTIDVTGANTLSYAGVRTMNSGISGTGNLTKVGTGTLSLSGRNTYTGTTFVNEGTLALVGGPIPNQNEVIMGPLIIGDDIGAPNTAIVIESGGFGTIKQSSPITVNSDGLWRMEIENMFHNGQQLTTPLVINRGNVSVTASFRLNTLQMIGGSIRGSGFGEIDLDDSLTATSDASGNEATISSKVILLTSIVTTLSKVFTINDGPGSTDLLISGVISQDPSETMPVGITKQGTGTLVLSGDNTYTGDTIIRAGTLQLGNGGTSGSIVGDVVDNGTFAVNRSDTFTFNGAISGSGAFAQIGTGTTVLTGANTYTGGTTISTGTLQLGNGGTSGSIVGRVVDNGTFAVNRSDTFTFNGAISGSGAFAQIGTGTTVLTGANTYTGSTIVNGGTLVVGRINTLPLQTALTVATGVSFNLNNFSQSIGSLAGAGSVTLGTVGTATLTTGNDNTSTDFSGVISGLGGLTKVGTGTQTLSGENTYAGATTVNGGTLAAGAINTLPTQTALTVATGATFDLNNFSQSIGSLAGAGSVTLETATLTTGNDNTSTDFSGVISGLGGLTKVGTGTQTLTGANTYTGGTTISTGTLQLGNGGTSGSIVGRVVDNGTFAVNRSNTFTFHGVISGGGAFAQLGTGTTVLTGINTYTGPTMVDGGTLLVDGSIGAGQTSVNAGGILGGVGTIGGNVLNRGIVSPGDSPGRLTIAGDYTQTTSGTLRIEVAGLGMNQHDMLVVNGKATLAGTLEVIPLNNFQFQPGNEITFLTAKGGVSGTFKPLENPFLLISVDQSSIPNSVTLEVLAVSEPPPFVSIPNIGVSLANVQFVNLSRRMDEIHAERRRGFSSAGLNINGSLPNFSGGLAGPTGPEGKSGPSVMESTPENRWGVFVTGLGEFTNVGDTSNTRGFDLTTGGLTFGADYLVSPNFAIGLTGGYANTNADLGNNSSLDVNGGTIGAYATGFGGGFYVNTAAFGVFNGYDSHRTALLGTASGNTDGQDFNAGVEAGYDWKPGGLTIGPLASFQYSYVGFDGFTEHGSVAPLSFNNQNAESTRTALGAKASYDWHVGQVVVKPELRAAWQHEFGDTEYSIVSRLADGAGSSFTVNGPAIGRDSLLIGAGAAVLLNERVSVYAYYNGELARTNYSSNNVSAGLRITF